MHRHFQSSVFVLAVCLFSQVSYLRAAEEGKPLWQPYYISPRAGSQHLALDGRWQLGYRDAPIERLQDLDQGQEWISAEVPSSVQWALFRAGELPDPYQHRNSKKYSWVVEKVWYYRRSFATPPGARSQYAFLSFDGVDYFARVWLNGTLLGRHEGMFGGPDVEVSGLLRDGSSNELVVEVKAANYGVGEAWKPELPGKVVLPWGLTGGWG